MKRIVIALALFAGLTFAADQTYTGTITDTMCGSDHAHMGVTPTAKCVRDCVKGGTHKYALLTPDNKVFVLSDQAAPAKFAAQKVQIKGTLYEKTGVLKVASIAPVK